MEKGRGGRDEILTLTRGIDGKNQIDDEHSHRRGAARDTRKLCRISRIFCRCNPYSRDAGRIGGRPCASAGSACGRSPGCVPARRTTSRAAPQEMTTPDPPLP